MVEVLHFTESVLDRPDFQELCEELCSITGMTTLASTKEGLFAQLYSSLDETDREFFIIYVDNIVAGICSVKIGTGFYYCTSLERVLSLHNSAEFCSLFVRKQFRHCGLGIINKSISARLNYLLDKSINTIFVQLRSVQNSATGEPDKLESNKPCWPGAITSNYTDETGPMKLLDSNLSVHDDALPLQKLYEHIGFSIIGLNAYDNGPVLALSYFDLPKAQSILNNAS